MNEQERLVAAGELTQWARDDKELRGMLDQIAALEGKSIGEVAQDSPEKFEAIYATARGMHELNLPARCGAKLQLPEMPTVFECQLEAQHFGMHNFVDHDDYVGGKTYRSLRISWFDGDVMPQEVSDEVDRDAAG